MGRFLTKRSFSTRGFHMICRSRLLILSLSLLVSAAGFGLDLDYGGLIENDTGLTWLPSFVLNQRDKVSAWFSTDIGEYLSFGMQGSYTYTTPIPVIVNLDYLEFGGSFHGILGESVLFDFSIGRFFFSDFSGAIFAHTMDGLSINVAWPGLSISATAGYTGLVLKPLSGIVLSNLDLIDRYDDSKVLAPPRLIGVAAVSFPEILLRQTVDLTFLLQQDLRPEDELISAGDVDEFPDGGGPVHTQYYGLGISGPLLGLIYYQAAAFLQTGTTLSYRSDAASSTGGSYQLSNTLAGYGQLSVEIYLARFLSSRISAVIRYATGDADFATFAEGNTGGDANMFTPVTDVRPAYIFIPQTGNLASGRIGYVMLPLEWTGRPTTDRFQSELSSTVFFRTTAGPISAGGVNTDSDALYLGTEIDLTFNYRPFSDLGVAIGLGYFIPNTHATTGALLPEAWANTFTGRFRLFLSF